MFEQSIELRARCRRHRAASVRNALRRSFLLLLFALLFLFPLSAAAQITVTIAPTSVNLAAGGTEQFSANVVGSADTAVNWTVLEGAGGGMVTSTGFYTAPAYPGTFHIVATSQADLSQSATAIAVVPGFLRPDMRQARVFETATTLQDGTILFAGGQGPAGDLSSAEVYNPTTGTFTFMGNMTITRNSHAAALLNNGQVLIAGGYTISTSPDSVTATAELYNPASGTFTVTGSMSSAREEFTATTLPNGQVLVAGGAFCSSTCTFLQTAELYDPASGTFSPTGSLITPRDGHTAILLANGLVLIAGGTGNSSQPLASTELYNPATGTFTSGPSMSTPREDFSATLLSGGNVLLAGGIATNPPLATADIYNSGTNTISPTGNMNFGRYSHTATLLANGQVLVAGGAGNFPCETSGLVPPTELYDPTTGTFAVAASLNEPRSLQTAALLANGEVLIAGGAGDLSVLDSAELYDPVAAVFTTKSVLMKTQRAFNTQTQLPDGRVLVTGGINGSSSCIYSSAELYDPSTGKFAFTGSMSAARQSHTATLLNTGKVLVVGGWGGASGPALGAAELFDPTAGTFSLTGSLITARANHAASLLPNGEVLITGGQGSAGDLSSAELYDPVAGTFSATGSMTSTRFWHTSTLLNTGLVLIAGGGMTTQSDLNPVTFLATAELFNPSTGMFSATGSLLAAPEHQTATLLPSGQVFIGNGLFSSEIYNPNTSQFSGAGNFSGLNPQIGITSALLPNGQVIMAGGTNVFGLTSELYDPIANVIVTGDNIRSPRVSATASVLLGGDVMIVGGTDFTTDQAGSRSVDFYQSPQTGQVPTVTSVTPSTLTGFNAAVITIQGTGFLPTAVVTLDAYLPLATTYVSASELTATVPASEMTNTATHQIYVSNLGGQASLPFAVLIQNAVISVTPANSPVSFGSVPIGTPSSIQSATIGAGGNGPLDLGPISITGANAGDFTISNSSSCPINGGSVQPQNFCMIALTFTPTGSGTLTAQISIPNNSIQPLVTVGLAGTGIMSPSASLSATTLTFANQGLGSTSAPQSLTLTNIGDLPLIISGIALSISNDFSSTNNCPASLAAGTNCAISVSFTPFATGPRTASLSINDNAPPNGSQIVSLTGTGIDVSLGPATGGSTSATIPSGQTATFNLQAAPLGGVSETIAFSVNCTGIPSAACGVSPNPLVTSPTAPSPFSVTVKTMPFTAGSTPVSTPWQYLPRISFERFLFGIAFSFFVFLLLAFLAARGHGTSKVHWDVLAAALALFLVLANSRCSGGSSSAGPQGTPPNNYPVVVTATSQGFARTITLTLIVQ